MYAHICWPITQLKHLSPQGKTLNPMACVVHYSLYTRTSRINHRSKYVLMVAFQAIILLNHDRYTIMKSHIINNLTCG